MEIKIEKIKLFVKNKKIILICAAAAVLIIAAVTAVILSGQKIKAEDTLSLKSLTKSQDITLYAHRGLSSQAPENTLPAFEKAAEKGLKAVEFDIQLTKDGVWVLSHDTSIKRMTDGKGDIDDYTYFDLADFSVDNGANYKKYPDLKMPSLDAALECCLENDLEPMIEIKDYTDKGIKSLVDSVKSHGFEKSCRVISFDHSALEKVRENDRDIQLVYLVSKLDNKQMELCLEYPDIGVSFKADKRRNDSEKVKKLISNDTELFCWVVDGKKELDYYYKSGVRNFVTNRIVP